MISSLTFLSPAPLRRSLWLLVAAILPGAVHSAEEPIAKTANSDFEVKFDAGALVSLKSARDPQHTEFVQAGKRLGDVLMRFRRTGGEWLTVQTADLAKPSAASANSDSTGCSTRYFVTSGPATTLVARIEIKIQQQSLLWRLHLQNTSIGRA